MNKYTAIKKACKITDDIFSELDHEHKDVVIEMTMGQQTIITTADPHYVDKLDVAKVEL